MLSSVICKGTVIVPADSGDIESVSVDLPLAVSRLRSVHVVRVVFEYSVGIVNTSVESARAFVVNIDAFRNSFEFYALGLSVICESALVVPSDAGHVYVLLPDGPVECHVIRSKEVVRIRIDEHRDCLVIPRGDADLIAVSDAELFRHSGKSHFMSLSVKVKRLVVRPSC